MARPGMPPREGTRGLVVACYRPVTVVSRPAPGSGVPVGTCCGEDSSWRCCRILVLLLQTNDKATKRLRIRRPRASPRWVGDVRAPAALGALLARRDGATLALVLPGGAQLRRPRHRVRVPVELGPGDRAFTSEQATPPKKEERHRRGDGETGRRGDSARCHEGRASV